MKAADISWLEDARQIVATCWCDEETEHIPMDPALAAAFAKRLAWWMKNSAQHAANERYWMERALKAETGVING